ncbi:MAG TPA: RNA methyltransferase [Bacteroidales bacterium]|nr:RNA methyltransferase [Bacteroidales bacterium]HOK98806.1 RNA methyltransferase [Bacteroidales bacterium]HPO64970.1 RNA methyltransferase [Bacteroidales bacterium]
MSREKLLTYLQQFVSNDRIKLINEKIEHRTRYITLLVENIYQSHNASAILRTSDCFGVQDVYIVEKNNRFSANEEVALGAQQWLTVKTYPSSEGNTRQAIEELKQKGYRVVATALHKNAQPLENFDFKKGKVAFMLGTELTGLTEEALSLADEYVIIPMRGFTQSLNVSVAAGILLHFSTWRVLNSDIPWSLSEEEKLELKIQWLKKSIRHGDLIEQRYLSQFNASSQPR